MEYEEFIERFKKRTQERLEEFERAVAQVKAEALAGNGTEKDGDGRRKAMEEYSLRDRAASSILPQHQGRNRRGKVRGVLKKL
ncbi:hypothetical protein EML15_05790 [Corynebacterium sp. sy017]|uniref:hypothetical protein n=1 Tax=unclassified Corynebacterium TaxID=2624378 RepID=UPI001186D5EB|nr:MULTISPECIES: hypothetical protein [unclassified Corynebacterium]MBP3088659.1 hypothetical protein [Corynebacterium sp. sy017]QDZ42066.1 hypothetical protein FQV43_01910 [Corynebacterium sp. sy039]TSD91951.1 hypothetical protein ELY17_05790 [Corynebacterium sp. SY003]